MEGDIEGANEKGIGVTVTDNNGVEHRIEMKFDGEIAYHSQDVYPDDASERTWSEDEHVSQARKFARYYVYNNTDHDPLAGYQNPDRLTATLMTMWESSSEEVNDLFSTFRQQSRSHHENVHRPVDLPDGIDDEQPISYRQQVYLDADIDQMRGSVETFVEEMADSTAAALGEVSVGNLFEQSLESVVDAVTEQAAPQEISFPKYDVENTSELYYRYYVARGETKTVERGDPYDFERKPDARLELPQLPPAVGEEFKPFLMRHLVCQVRDIYLTMGLEPPAPYRVLGPGKHAPTQRYRHHDFYPDYFDFDADIPGYAD